MNTSTIILIAASGLLLVFSTIAATDTNIIISKKDNNIPVAFDIAQTGISIENKTQKSIGIEGASVEQHNCTFFHSVEAPPELRRQIDSREYGIIKLEDFPT